jgi:hypothetical protein
LGSGSNGDGLLAYNASRNSVEGTACALREELKPFGVSVVTFESLFKSPIPFSKQTQSIVDQLITNFFCSNFRCRGHPDAIFSGCLDALIPTGHRAGIIRSSTLRLVLALRAKQQISMQSALSLGVCTKERKFVRPASLRVEIQHCGSIV